MGVEIGSRDTVGELGALRLEEYLYPADMVLGLVRVSYLLADSHRDLEELPFRYLLGRLYDRQRRDPLIVDHNPL